MENGEIKKDYTKVFSNTNAADENNAQTQRTADQTVREGDKEDSASIKEEQKKPEPDVDFDQKILNAFQKYSLERENTQARQPYNHLADEIANFSNEISDMREMQGKLVDNYK